MNVRNRKSNRLQHYDYAQAGYYFVTICTQHRKELFGEIIDSQMVTNTAGEMVATTWNELPKFYHGIQMDQFQMMPNHIHGIIVIVGDGPRAVPNEPDGQPRGGCPYTIPVQCGAPIQNADDQVIYPRCPQKRVEPIPYQIMATVLLRPRHPG